VRRNDEYEKHESHLKQDRLPQLVSVSERRGRYVRRNDKYEKHKKPLVGELKCLESHYH
jgi:hypothetical protein